MIAADLLPHRSHEIVIEGRSGSLAKMRYLDEGPRDRPVILCVHGNPTWSFYYRHIVDHFAAKHRVIAVDHIGCGRSDKPSTDDFDYCLGSHRDNLVKLIDELDLRHTTLLAHDWGGAIGLSALVERTDRFKKIVLLNTAAFPPPYLPRRIAVCRWPILGPLGVRGVNAFARAAQFMTTARAPLSSEVKRGMIAPYDNWANRVAINAFVQDIPMHPSHRTHAVLAELEKQLPSLRDMPKLLIWGMKDWCFRPECLRRFQAMWPEAESVEIEDAGHYVLEDATEETIVAMDAFLSTTALSGTEAG